MADHRVPIPPGSDVTPTARRNQPSDPPQSTLEMTTGKGAGTTTQQHHGSPSGAPGARCPDAVGSPIGNHESPRSAPEAQCLVSARRFARPYPSGGAPGCCWVR
jgi:hypothetical protein